MAGTFNIDIHSLLNTIDAVMAENDETNEWLEALKHNVNTLAKTNDREYNRGLDDCWEMIKKIYMPGGYSINELHKIFFNDKKYRHSDQQFILESYTPQEALKRIEEYETKKKEEEEKPKHGDLVMVRVPDRNYSVQGVFIASGPSGCTLMLSDGKILTIDLESWQYTIEKTGGHVDILGELNKANWRLEV